MHFRVYCKCDKDLGVLPYFSQILVPPLIEPSAYFPHAFPKPQKSRTFSGGWSPF